MKEKNLKGNGRITVVRTEIQAPYANGIVTSVLPLVGPGTYQGVMTRISEDGLLRPTTGQTLALINLALQNPNEEHCKNILKGLRNKYFWTSTENLWGSEDVILYDNVDGKMPTDRASLLKRMKDGDNSVRVVPYGFETGSQSVSEFVRNPYVIAQAQGVPEEVLAFIAQKASKNKPSVYALDPQRRDTKRYSALSSGGFYYGLDLDGSYCVDHGGYFFGVCKEKRK